NLRNRRFVSAAVSDERKGGGRKGGGRDAALRDAKAMLQAQSRGLQRFSVCAYSGQNLRDWPKGAEYGLKEPEFVGAMLVKKLWRLEALVYVVLLAALDRAIIQLRARRYSEAKPSIGVHYRSSSESRPLKIVRSNTQRLLNVGHDISTRCHPDPQPNPRTV
ncbi:MAG: hypothetical protein VB144_06625, partial [Clostridia bacterium]|nr:hypothetical protein [Clostridia bacterium]